MPQKISFRTSFPLATAASKLCLWWLIIATASLSLQGQNNLVPNHSFEDISDCDLQFGDIPKAPPWQIVPEPENSPDLYHYCSTSGFYVPPAGCGSIQPKEGEGMIGLAQNIPPEERVYVRLTDTLPWQTDIYVAFSTASRGKCGIPPVYTCHANMQCLAFSDFAFQDLEVVLQPDSIITESEQWTTLRTCYRANGTEDFVLLGNYRDFFDIRMDCDTIVDENFSYNYFDEIIVAPFDVVPDTIVICHDEVVTLDASFYDLPISWSDGQQGAMRDFDRGGRFIALGSTGNCWLHDTMYVVQIPEEQASVELSLCDGEVLTLEAPVTAIWPNGDTSRTYNVTEAGIYDAELIIDCEEQLRSYRFEVDEGFCDISYFVPNVFSPNRDGVNDELDFFFESEFNFDGQLHILDRWGNLLFQRRVTQDDLPLRWDGTFRGKPLGQGVYIWAYEYTSGKDGQTRVIAGDAMLLR